MAPANISIYQCLHSASGTLNDCSPEGLKLNPTAEATFLDSVLTARTFENTCGELLLLYLQLSAMLIHQAVIFANAGGPPGKGYAGLSQVTVPYIGPLARLGSCLEGMAT